MQHPIRYISVDDNPLDQLILKEYATSYPFLEPVAQFSDPQQALPAIDTLKPDLVFLDIEMPGTSGIDLLRQVREKVAMAIFITSHTEFALDGFELSALDYIIKPLTAERFHLAALRVQEYWSMHQKAALYDVAIEQDSLTIREGHSQVKLPVSEIIYLEAMQDYTKVVTEKKNYLTLTTLTAFLEKLSTGHFLRVHRSYAVALKKINELHSNKLICGNSEIPIGKTYRAVVSQLKL